MNIQNDELNVALAYVWICLLIIFFIILGGFVTNVCWNLFMPEVFGLMEIGLTKGIAIFILANILFGNINISYN
jgi:hypothetical protein